MGFSFYSFAKSAKCIMESEEFMRSLIFFLHKTKGENEMKVLRKLEALVQETNEFKNGDQIQIGKYTATCQKVTRKGALFLLDQYLDDFFKMNDENTNVGGYEASKLRMELQKDSILEIFEPVRSLMIPFKNGDLLRIPYAEEFFGDINAYESSGKKQWLLMQDRKNRIAECRSSSYAWGWLQNKLLDTALNFAVVSGSGLADSYGASSTHIGVRPVFRLYL